MSSRSMSVKPQSKRRNASYRRLQTSSQVVVSRAATPTSSRVVVSRAATPKEVRTTRDACEVYIAQHLPDVKPIDDFALMSLAMYHYNGDRSNEAAAQWVELQRGQMLTFYGNVHELQRRVDLVLSTPLHGAIGMKPASNEDVLVAKIPNSPYRLRLWPAPNSRPEYTMDFIDYEGEPVNSPFKFDMTHLGFAGESWPVSGPKIRSLENCFGVDTDDINPGQEKFLLPAKQVIMFRRPGLPDAFFIMPPYTLPPAPPPPNTHYFYPITQDGAQAVT